MGRLLSGLIIVIFVLGAAYWWWSNSLKQAAAPVSNNNFVTEPKNEIPPLVQAPNQMNGAVQEIMVSGNEFSFSPATLNLKKGQAVKVTFTNTGKYPHNFAITDMNVTTKTIGPGQKDSIQFTPDRTGTFTYVCTVGDHAEKGMKGTTTIQ